MRCRTNKNTAAVAASGFMAPAGRCPLISAACSQSPVKYRRYLHSDASPGPPAYVRVRYPSACPSLRLSLCLSASTLVHTTNARQLVACRKGSKLLVASTSCFQPVASTNCACGWALTSRHVKLLTLLPILRTQLPVSYTDQYDDYGT